MLLEEESFKMQRWLCLPLLKTSIVLRVSTRFLNIAHGALYSLVPTCLSRELFHPLLYSVLQPQGPYIPHHHFLSPPGLYTLLLGSLVYSTCPWIYPTHHSSLNLNSSLLSDHSYCHWWAGLCIPTVSCTWPFQIAITPVTFCLTSTFPTRFLPLWGKWPYLCYLWLSSQHLAFAKGVWTPKKYVINVCWLSNSTTVLSYSFNTAISRCKFISF